MTQTTKRIISLGLIALLMVAFIFMSIESRFPYDSTLRSLSTLHTLQVRLQKDLLRYKQGDIGQYDTINKHVEDVIKAVEETISTIDYTSDDPVYQMLKSIRQKSLVQRELIEDFKTSNATTQNSLSYFSHKHESAISDSDRQYVTTTQAISKLSTYLLQYTRTPVHDIAKKVYPILDDLNADANADIRSMINHSLIIIEQLPEIVNIIDQVTALGMEADIKETESEIYAIEHRMDQHARIYNALLFICSIYIIIYLGILFVALKRNKEELSKMNERLSTEIEDRTKTEKTLSMLVKQNPNNESDDHVYSILNAVCESLSVRYGYISYISNEDSSQAVMAGLIDNNSYKKHISYELEGSPCDDVLSVGRVVCNRDLNIEYFHMQEFPIKEASSYIGIALKDENEKIKGLIAIAHDEPIENTNLYESILKIAASRASSELLRQIEQQNNSRYQEGLRRIDKWISILIASASDRNAFFKNVCLATQDITGASLAALPVLDENRQNYSYIEATGNQSEALKRQKMSLSDGGICAWVMINARSLLIEDVKLDLRAKKQLTDAFDIRSALVTPVELDNTVYGAIAAFKSDEIFDEIDEQLLNQLSRNIQMALANMQLVSDIETERERAQVTLHSIGDAVITTDNRGDIEYMNQIAEKLTGWPLTSVKNSSVKKVFRIFDQDTRESMVNLLDTCLLEGISINKSTVTLSSRDEIEREIECSMSPILNTDNTAEGVVIIFHDETDRHRLEHIIKHQSTHDSLTGLINRDEFAHQLTEHIYDTKNLDRTHTLAIVDLDQFKLINDACGHTAGDELLKAISIIINRCTRNGDIIGRIGGDQFGIILENCKPDSAVHITEKIVEEIHNAPFIWEEKHFNVTASIGITEITTQSVSASDTMTQADVACHTAKDYGSNRVMVYQQEDNDLIRKKEETYWAARIADAIEKDRFKFYAQPIRGIFDHERDHYEILLRMEDENGQLTAPNAFIPAAERYNLMSGVDRLVVENTFRFIKEVNDPDIDDTLFSINISGNSLSRPDFIKHIGNMLEQYEIDPRNICFEITETSAIINLEETRSLIMKLKEMGCLFTLDDFGSGISSFGYLKNLPVDFIKIDGSFVRDMVENKIDHAMVAAINQIGHVMNIRTIAEFVENENILEELRKLDVDFAQGYHIAKPAPLEDIFKNRASVRHLHDSV